MTDRDFRSERQPHPTGDASAGADNDTAVDAPPIVADTTRDADSAASPPVQAGTASTGHVPTVHPVRPPRIWTLFAALGAAIIALVIGQIVVGAALVQYLWMNSPASVSADFQQITQRLQAMVTTPLGLILFTAPVELALVATAMLAARRSPKPFADRLGLRLPRMRWQWYPIFALATIVPFAVSVGAAALGARLQSPDTGVLRIWESADWATGTALVLFISIAPGFAEELFFRGYIQRRLLARYSPWVAILVTSFVFGLFHVMPAAFMLAFTLGIWLGVLAWRTGSIWPGALCHAAVNGTWNAVQIGGRLLGFDMSGEQAATTTDWVILGAILAVGVVFFAMAIAKLRRCRPTIAYAA